MLSPRRALRVRALTIVEVVAATAATSVLVAAISATASNLRGASNEAISMANLMQLGMGQALYAWDHGDLQWCGHQSDFGVGGANCANYVNTIGCPDQHILGWGYSGDLWGYWLGGGMCPPNYPGNCGNWILYWPNEWGTTNGVSGSWRLTQVRSMHNYINGRYFDPVYYAPNDRITYQRAARYFDAPAEFVSAGAGIANGSSSYGMSPAAMWNPQVMRAPAQGGFRSPSTFADSFARQSLFGALHPELKSLLFEVNWNQGGKLPSPYGIEATQGVYRYNQGAAATPITLFYDGHVWFLPNQTAIDDDAALRARGLDGLWSRDTPLGNMGYYGNMSVDGSITSHSVLTTDGLHGRDVLSAP